MQSKFILYKVSQFKAHIKLNHSEKKNALSLEVIKELVSALKLAEADEDVRVIILSGEGNVFSAGGDIKNMQGRSGMFSGESADLWRQYKLGIQQIPKQISQMSKPLIGLINGAAVGAGCDLACMCDLRYGSDKTFFLESFSKLSLVPGDGGTHFLPKVVGYPRAMEMILTAERVSAKKAKDWGLLNEIFKEDELVVKVEEIANQIAQNAPIATQMAKRALVLARDKDLQSHLELLASFQGIAQRLDDHFEGLSAMNERRAPDFKGQ